LSYIGDPDRVRQILLNLLGNACKFTEPGGWVEVRCGTAREIPPETRLAGEGPWAYVAVEDTGIGISSEYQRRIFEPFVQVSDAALRAHTRGLLSELGEMLELAYERGGAVSDVLRDESRIQQVIAQLHGAQRHELGWSEEALRRDLEILRETIEQDLEEAECGQGGSG
jgi:K+-sensing histidine kinase KdpD